MSRLSEILRTLGRTYELTLVNGDASNPNHTTYGDDIISVTYEYEGSRFSTLFPYMDIEISEKELQYYNVGDEISVLVVLSADEETESIVFGDFRVFQIQKNKALKTFNIVCYQGALMRLKNYPTDYSITGGSIGFVIRHICTACGLSPNYISSVPTGFINRDIEVSNVNTNGMTYLDILECVAPLLGAYIYATGDDLYITDILGTNDTDIIGDDISGDCDVSEECQYTQVAIKVGDEIKSINTTKQIVAKPTIYLIDNNPLITSMADGDDFLPGLATAMDNVWGTFRKFNAETFGVLWTGKPNLPKTVNAVIGEETVSIDVTGSTIVFETGIKQTIKNEGSKYDNDNI